MKKYLLFCIIVTILFVACDSTNDFGTPFTKGQEVTLSAAIGDASNLPNKIPNKNRVTGIDNKTDIQLVWDEGDQIKVIVGKESAIFTLTSGAGSSDGSFTGIMPADGTSFHVEYPIDYSDDVLKVQQYVPNGFGKGLMKMSTNQAGTMDNGFTLSADNALLGLQLTGNRKIGKIVLSRNNSAGKVGDESYTLLCPNVVLTAEPTLFYIVVLPGTWANGFTVEVIANDNSVVIDRFVKTSSITFGTDMATIMPEKNVQNPPKRIGVFSVAADKQVSFSQGNVQYTQSTDEWCFAREQYEYIGAASIKDGALADKIDLFGWSANNTTAPFGVSTSTNAADYAGDFVDWGTNTICGDAPGTWRTLSADEWEYLLKKRKNASDLYGVAQVAGVNGMIILPDDWEEANGIVFKSGLHSSQVNDYSVYQSFTDAQWLVMGNAGAVFLPALGYRDGTNVEKCNTSGYYWSNTTSDEKSAYRLYFYSYFLAPNGVHSKYRGRSVRLVHDTIQ